MVYMDEYVLEQGLTQMPYDADEIRIIYMETKMFVLHFAILEVFIIHSSHKLKEPNGLSQS